MQKRVGGLLAFSLLLFLAAAPSLSVATTDLNSLTPLQLAQLLAGPGVTVSNVTFTGAKVAAGSFTGGLADGIGIDSGVILSSGNVANAVGPNDDDGITGINGTQGDADLDAIVGEDHSTFEAAVLEFDFVPSSNTISFRYVFASDEYNEFVGQFNDVFAFYIDGQNVALIPGTTTPVAINTVNLETNSSFYRNNDPSDLGIPTPFGTQFDGFTTVFTASATLTPNVTHHIKLAIADTDDPVLDSAVFLQAASFVSQNLTIAKSAPASVVSGSNLTYTITYGNTGNAGVSNVVVTDPVPAGTTFVSATSGGQLSEGGVVTWNVGTVGPGVTGQTLSFTVRVTATSGNVTNSNYTIQGQGLPTVTGSPVTTAVEAAGCPAIALAPATLPNGVLGVPYSSTITASGGAGPYSFAVTAGTLPTGLSLSSSGVLSGTPKAAGEYSFTVTATDQAECTGERTYSIAVSSCAAITISPATLANATIGGAFLRKLEASGGRIPYTFRRTAGSLPPGATLSPEGVLSGTLTTPGTYTFTVTATDANQCTGSVTYTLRVVCATVTVLPATLPPGALGLPYNQALTADGGRRPHNFAVTAGALPDGLLLSPEGVLSGTPGASGSFTFTVTATDASGCSGAAVYTLGICISAVTLSPSDLPAGTTGSPYSQTISASGGIAPYAFAVSSGALPEGLNLSASGVLSGVPAASGEFFFDVTATDANGCPGTRSYGLLICPVLAVSPENLPAGSVGVAYSETLAASGGAEPSTFAVTAGALPAGLTLSSTGTVSGTPSQSGVFSFTVAATDVRGCFGARAYTIAVTDAPPRIIDLNLSPAGDSGFLLSVTGSGFVEGAVIVVDGISYPATFFSPTLVTATLPASAIPETGTITVTVVNPGASGGTSNPATLTFCSPPEAPRNPVIEPFGNPSGSPTATDFLVVRWEAPATGPPPSSYEFRINGDSFSTVVGATSAVVPPRGSNDPITLFVRAQCNGDVSGAETASPTYSLAPPVADFTFSAARVGTPVVFTDTSSPQATSWLWIFDDGETSTLQSPSHTFTSAGTHRVALIASNGSGSSTRIQEVAVSAAATAGARALARSARVFRPAGAGRWTLPEVSISAVEPALLEISSAAPEETVVFLRLLDPDGQSVLERRLAIAPGETAVNDVGAYGLEGVFTLEIVSDRRVAALLSQPAGVPDERRRRPDEKF